MKICATCGIAANDDRQTCASCGEASWIYALAEPEVKPELEPRAAPKDWRGKPNRR